MADSVRCTTDANHLITCDVEIDAEPTTPAGTSGPPPARPTVTPAPPPADPAVAALVTSYKKVTLPAPDVSYVSLKALADCASSEITVGLALASKAGPVLAALTAAKAGFDLSKCLTLEHNAAAQAAVLKEATDNCAAQGGVIIGDTDGVTTCEVDRSGR